MSAVAVPISVASSGSAVTVPGAVPDGRPLFRVGVFGLTERLRRLAEIVLRHARHNEYRFELSASTRSADYDIALVDMTVRGGREVAEALRSLPRPRPVVRVGRRGDAARGRDDLLQSSFAINLIKILNRVVAELIARHQGRLGKGTGLAEDEEASLRRSAQPARVLVVDDSPTVRHQLELALRQMGLVCYGVPSADLAIEALRHMDFSLAFVDVVMPEMDGYQLTRAIKRDPRHRKMPVVILTSRSSPFDLARGALAGCNTYLVKPVQLTALRETVGRHVRVAVTASAGVPDGSLARSLA